MIVDLGKKRIETPAIKTYQLLSTRANINLTAHKLFVQKIVCNVSCPADKTLNRIGPDSGHQKIFSMTSFFISYNKFVHYFS